MGIGETFRRALAKLVIRASGEQAKTACGNLQLCAGLKAGIEVATHAVGQRSLDRSRVRRSKEEARRTKEEEIVDVDAGKERLKVVMVGTGEEESDFLEAALEMEVDG